MKKIVALALSLVMVLGLATTAFAATSYGNLTLKATDAAGTKYENMTLTAVKAAAPKYDTKTGAVTAMGTVAHFVDQTGAMFVQVNTLGEADIVAYADAACKVVKFYLDQVTDVQYYEGTVFTNFGKSCGQVDLVPAEDAVYYTINGDLGEFVYVGDETGTQVKVAGKMVTVDPTPVAIAKVGHTIVTESENGKVVKAYCSVCKLQAAKAPNFASIPEKAVYFTAVDGSYWYWTNTTEAPAAGTVESAKTFDAGIAMYVGMSVMAAAGSAVVLKKKD